MSVEDLKKYEKKKKEVKDKILRHIKEKNGDWVSEEQIKKELDCDFSLVGVDEALTGEFWSVRKKIESKAAKVEKDGYSEWVEFYRLKPYRKTTRFWSILVLIVVILTVILFHLYFV